MQHDARDLPAEGVDFAEFEDAREAWAVEGILQRSLPLMTGRTIYHFDVRADQYAKKAAPCLHAALMEARNAPPLA